MLKKFYGEQKIVKCFDSNVTGESDFSQRQIRFL